MRIDPQLRALRGDDRPQRAAQAAMEQAKQAWLSAPDMLAVKADLRRHAEGADLADLPHLRRLLVTSGKQDVSSWMDRFTGVMAAHPLGQVPLRFSRNARFASLLLLREGRAQLSLVSYEPGTHDCASVTFGDGIRSEAILAGQAEGALVHSEEGGACRMEPVRLEPGQTFNLDLARQSLIVRHAAQRTLALRIARQADCPQPVREVRLADGGEVRRASADLQESRREMMASLLGRMNHAPAAPALARMASAGSDQARWHALRECLALDTRLGFTTLCAIARTPDDPLAAHAGALRAQLIETHPQLAELEPAPCPA